MKRKIVVANLKMNLNIQFEISRWLESLLKAQEAIKTEKVEMIFCPQAFFLEKFIAQIKGEGIDFGIQDCFWEQKGSFTGALSPVAAKTVGANYLILGHSEKKRYFGENGKIISLKMTVALKAGLSPILCVGETREERKAGQGFGAIKKQLEDGLATVTPGKIEKLIFCYEPVWAISSNQPEELPTVNEIMEARLMIKKFLANKFNQKVAEKATIIYGGSVDSKNAGELCFDSGMNGALVGKASLSPFDFLKIAEKIAVN